VVTLSSDSRPIIGRGPPLGAGLFFLGVVSVVVMVLDHRGGYLDTARLWMSAAANPVYAVVQTPYQLWSWLTGSFADRSRLRTENEQLTEQLRIARMKQLRFDALSEENRRLREIREASKGVSERTLIAEVINVSVQPFRHMVVINKGADDGVFRGQPVLDAFGVVGQVMQVGKSTAKCCCYGRTSRRCRRPKRQSRRLKNEHRADRSRREPPCQSLTVASAACASP
jgi:rod shape-determining protein MreC